MSSFRQRVSLGVALLAVAAIGAFLRVPVSAQNTSPGTIVYERVPENSGPWPTIDIYSVEPDGTNDKALTHDGHSHSPSWSPDGKRILFIHDAALQTRPSYTDHEPTHHAVELYAMNRDGSDAKLLKRLEPMILSAAWSPGGKDIVIQAGPPPQSSPGSYLYLFSPEGRGDPRLLFEYPAVGPAWSPDGKRLLFFRKYGPWTPFVANADGSNATQLKVNSGLNLSEPAWSPDGKHLAFANADARGSVSQIFVMSEDGSEVRQLTHDPDWEYCRHPSWSPDGERIAFSCTSRTARCQQAFFDDGRPMNPWCVRRLFVISPSDPPQYLTPLTDNYGSFPAFAPKSR